MRRPGWPLAASFLIVVGASVAGAAEADNRPLPLARFFPSKDLVAYVEFDGLDAHDPAWKRTAAWKILNETPTGAMLESVARQLFIFSMKTGGIESPSFDDLSATARQIVRSGFAFGVNRPTEDPLAMPSCIGLVLRGGAKGPLLPAIEKLITALGIDGDAIARDGGAGARKIKRIGSLEMGVSWWAEGDDLAFALLDIQSIGAMIAALDGRQPNAVEHPIRKELVASADGFETVGLAFLDARAVPEMPAEAVMLGLDGIKRIDIRWGFRGEALESLTRVVAPAPRKGVLALFDQPTFDSKSFPPLPSGVGSFAVASLDLARVFDQVAALIKQVDPAGADFLNAALDRFRAETGRRFREDVLANIGPRVLLADVPTLVLVPTSPFDAIARGMARVPRVSLLVEIKDKARLLADLDALAKWANERFSISDRKKDASGKPAPLLVRRLKNTEAGYEIALSPTYWPLPAGYRPSIVVGEKYVSLGTTPEVARLALRPQAELDPAMARTLASLPNNLTLVSVTDTKNSALPELLANVPSVIQWWAFTIQAGMGIAPLQNDQVFQARPIRQPVDAIGPAPVELVPAVPPGVPGAVVMAPVPPPAQPAEKPAEPPLTAPMTIPAFRLMLRFDPDEIPTPDEIRPLLFPASYSMSVDAQGFRFATREALPGWNPTGLFPLAVGMALPGIRDYRESVEKERLSVNLTEIGNALNLYQEKEGHFPPPAILDKNGKPLLSWRVALLPFLGQKPLYDEFHLDESWDSPHNKPLIARMPTAFAHPSAEAELGLTYYRGVTGPGAFFDPEVKEGLTLVMITDGTSNTLAIVEAKQAVLWTKPGMEIPFNGAAMLSLLGGHTPGKFAALFTDGVVNLIREAIDPAVLSAISTRAGGEVVDSDAF